MQYYWYIECNDNDGGGAGDDYADNDHDDGDGGGDDYADDDHDDGGGCDDYDDCDYDLHIIIARGLRTLFL